MNELEPYFDRIAYRGERAPTLKALQALHLLHAQSFAFENLSPLLGLEVPLDIPSLIDKFVMQGRGGWCYEHNLLFQHALHTLGFRTRGLAARVRMNVPDDVLTPRSHMLLLVDADDGQYIADVGFGGLTLTAPMRLEPGVQHTPHGPFRLTQDETFYTLSSLIGTAWKTLYVFDLQEQRLPDYQVSNWYLSHHPQSHFVTGLMAALPTAEGRHALRNNQYSYYGLDGRQEKETLTSADSLKRVLEERFRIRLPRLPHLDDRLATLLRA